MWHSKLHPELGETTSDVNYRSVEFGTHLTKSAALADAIVDIPIDEDLSTAPRRREPTPRASAATTRTAPTR